MAYRNIVQMAGSQSLIQRIAAAAAMEDKNDALSWASQNIWRLAASPGWDTAWEGAEQQSNRTKFNPDTGMRDDVITDAMILAAVQSLITEQTPAP
jgi:hypothetical protein